MITPSFDQTLIARAATGLYNLQIGSATTDWALEWVNGGNGTVADLVNQLYVRDFAAMSDADVAAMVVENVNITEPPLVVADATAYVAQRLGSVALEQKGAMILAVLQEFSLLADDPIYGSYATAFNAQISAAVAYAQIDGTIDVPLDQPESMEGKVFTLTAMEAAGADVMRLTGDQDVRIDFTNPANQVTGLDLDGDGTIEFNGGERSVTGVAADFEIVDAYARDPLNHEGLANNFLGDIAFDGTGFDGDGVSTDGNIFLGGLGVDVAFTGIGNDFLAGGGVAQGRGGYDYLSGGRNADFFFAEFSGIDATDGGQSLFIDGGNTADDSSAGIAQTAQDADWLLLEASDDDEPVYISLEEDDEGVNDDNDVESRSGEWMDIDDVEHFDASGNLYGFLDDIDVQIGGRAVDTRDDEDEAGSANYGFGSSAQLRVDGSDVANIVIAGYDNDVVWGNGGNDLLFGGNLQFLFETVEGGATNPNLAGITLNGRDEMYGGAGDDNIVFEADRGIIDGGTENDTLWLTNYHFGTSDAAARTTDGVVRFDLRSQTLSDSAGYGGANVNGTQDQTNYSGTGRVTVTNMENVDATGLGGIDYVAAGTNDPELNFANQQNHWGYNSDLDLRGTNAANNLYAGNGDDVLEGRGGTDDLMGGNGIDDFIFAIDGDQAGDGTDRIRRKIDADGDGLWDTTATGAVVWGQDFGQLSDVVVGSSALTVDFLSTDLAETGVDVAVFDVTIGGVLFEGGATATLAAATSADELAEILDAAFSAQDSDVSVIAVDNTVVVIDAAGRVIGRNIAEGTIVAGTATNGQLETLLSFGPADETFSQDRLIYKAYEDRNDNEGVNDDAVTGSLISLGDRGYAEDLVINFAADGTRLAESQAYAVKFTNLTTEDTVTIKVNGVEYSLQVGVALNGTQEDDEDGVGESQASIQSAFLQRMTDFINSFMDDDTSAGQVGAAYTAPDTITLTQVSYDGEETVFMTLPTVTLGNQSGGEKASVTVSNNAAHEVLLYQFDGRDNKLNADNVLFWGQEGASRAILETADAAGGMLHGSDALVINGGVDDLVDIPHNLATDEDDLDENFVVHGDDFLLGGAGADVIHGLSGDDRIQGSLGQDVLDGGGDWYFVRRAGEPKGTATYLNAHEASELDADSDVVDITLIHQTEDNENMIGGADFVPYFRDTLVYAQADFTPGATRFTITLNDYEGVGDEIDFTNGGAGTVGVDADGNGTVEAANVSTFTNFENIRTVSGVGQAVAGTNGGQGRDTLNVAQLSTDAEVGVQYDMTGDGGMVSLIEDPDDDEDTDNNVLRDVIEIDGVENVIFGLGDDALLIDETEAAKDNVVTGDLGDDTVNYLNNFDDEDEEGDDEPTVTVVVESSSNTDKVVMTEGRVGSVVATDTLSSIETIVLGGNTAAGVREDDVLDVTNVSDDVLVDFVNDEVSGDGDLLVTIVDMVELENVLTDDGEDTVLLADASKMSDNSRSDSWDERADIDLNTYLNFDFLDNELNRETIGDMRANNELFNDIPEVRNAGQFTFDLGSDTDRVDYSQTNDQISALVAVEAETNFVMVNGVGAPDGYRGSEDRIDALKNVEEIVASTGESVLDFTSLGQDVQISFQFDEDNAVESLDRMESLVRIADGAGNTIDGIPNFVEYYDLDDDDDIDAFDNATWNRIEGSDFAEAVFYDGSEDLVDLGGVDHRYSDDTLNLRGGDNNVSYFALETSITAVIDVSEFDEDFALTTGLIEVEIDFQDGSGGALAGAGTHEITSYTGDNGIAEGNLKLEASQDAEDSVEFTSDSDKIYFLGTSAGVVDVQIGDLQTMRLTGFEFLIDGDTDDVYDMANLTTVLGGLVLVDNDTDDEDTITVRNDAVGYQAAPADTIDLGVLNDAFGFDFDILDVTAVTMDDLILIGGSEMGYASASEVEPPANSSTLSRLGNEPITVDLNPLGDEDWYQVDLIEGVTYTFTNAVGTNLDPDVALYDTDGTTFLTGSSTIGTSAFSFTATETGTYFVEATFSTGTSTLSVTSSLDAADDGGDNESVLVGSLDLIDDVQLFDAILFTNASITSAGDTFTVDTDAGELLDDSADVLFTFDGSADTFDFSRVTSAVTVDTVGAAALTIIGGSAGDTITGNAGADTIEGNGGADTMDGSIVPAEGATYTVTLSGVTATSGAAGDTMTIAGLTITTSAAPALVTEIAAGADADQIGGKFASQTLADWEAALVGDGLSVAEASALASVTYDPLSNELVFAFDASVDGSTLLGATNVIDLTTAPAVTGAAVLGATEVDTDFTPQGDSVDTFVYNAASDSTAAAMDSILKFNIDAGVGSVDDIIDLSVFAGDANGALDSLVTNNTAAANFAALVTSANAADQDIWVGRTATDAYVFIDHDEDLDVDMVIKLVGVNDVSGITLGENFDVA